MSNISDNSTNYVINCSISYLNINGNDNSIKINGNIISCIINGHRNTIDINENGKISSTIIYGNDNGEIMSKGWGLEYG